MAPTQPALTTFFPERKQTSQGRVTRSLKLDHDCSSPGNTPSKTRGRRNIDKDKEISKTMTPSKSRSQEIVADYDEDVIPLILDDADDVHAVQSIASPSKRRNKVIKEPCSPPKIKCTDINNQFPDSSPKLTATPSTLLGQLSLTSPAGKRQSQCVLPPKSLFPETDELMSRARSALHTHAKTSLFGRDEELTQLNDFIQTHFHDKTSGSLYISGPPGTGKTACLTKVLEQPELKEQFRVVNINCTSMESPKAIYSRISDQLNLQARNKTGKAHQEAIEKYFSTKHKMILMVLDEMDQLDTRSRSVLYTIFEWPMTFANGIILIGIANALDLTDRLLPRLKSKLQLAPQLLHFAPYTKEQLVNIVAKRLEEANASKVFCPAALQFLASKVSAVNGDARRALETARRTVEKESQKFDPKSAEMIPVRMSPRKAMAVVSDQNQEKNPRDAFSPKRLELSIMSPSKSVQKSHLRSLKSPSKSPFKSPSKSPLKSPFKSPKSVLKSLKSPSRQNCSPLKENCSPSKRKSAIKSLNFNDDNDSGVKPLQNEIVKPQVKEPCISVVSVMNVINDVYGSTQGIGRNTGGEELPLHQKLAVCSLLLILREGKSKDVTVGKLHDVYRRVCKKRHMDPLDSGAFLSMLGLIEARGILLLPGRGKKSRLTKVCLQWIEDEVVSALQDRDLLAAIIKDKSCLS